VNNLLRAIGVKQEKQHLANYQFHENVDENIISQWNQMIPNYYTFLPRMRHPSRYPKLRNQTKNAMMI